MKTYHLPEASLLFPGEGWLDNSMNVFRHSVTQASVIVTRGKCAQNRSLDDELDAQWQQLLSMTEQFDMGPRKPVSLPGCPDVAARETCCSFTRAGVTYHQWQLALLLPDSQSLLVATQTTLNEPQEEDLRYRETLKQGIRLSR